MKNLTKLIRDEKKMFKNAGLRIGPSHNDASDSWRIDGQMSRIRKEHRGISRQESKLKHQEFI